MKNKSIKKNFVYNIILTFANMCFPLITAPYLSEVLGASGIGKVNYATAIISWFILIASFGIPRFAIREVAKHREDRETLSTIFWNMIFIQLILTLVSLIIYITMIFNIPAFYTEQPLYLTLALMLVFNIFSTDWFYQGIEEYGYITVRNVIVKTLSIILLFIFINTPEDYVLYAGLTVIVIVINNMVNFLNALRYVDIKIFKFNPIYYLKNLKIFFFIAFVIALYTQLDQIFLGSINEADLAFYVRSKSVLNIGLSLTTALITVLSPRAAYLAYNDWGEYKRIVQSSINYIYLIGIPISTGIFLLSAEAMYLLGGVEFVEGSQALKIIAPLSLISILGSWVSGQILIPNKMEKLSFQIQCVGVLISISLNLILIPKFSYIGAAMTWLVVETFLFITKAIYANIKFSEISVKYFTSSLKKYLLANAIMFMVIILIKEIITKEIITLFVAVLFGTTSYFIGLMLLKEEVLLNVLAQIKQKVQKKI